MSGRVLTGDEVAAMAAEPHVVSDDGLARLLDSHEELRRRLLLSTEDRDGWRRVAESCEAGTVKVDGGVLVGVAALSRGNDVVFGHAEAQGLADAISESRRQLAAAHDVIRRLVDLVDDVGVERLRAVLADAGDVSERPGAVSTARRRDPGVPGPGRATGEVHGLGPANAFIDRGFVVDAGGGEIRLACDRGMDRYPPPGTVFVAVPDGFLDGGLVWECRWTADSLEPLPGLVLTRCGFEAMGRRCSQAILHVGPHRLAAERTLRPAPAGGRGLVGGPSAAGPGRERHPKEDGVGIPARAATFPTEAAARQLREAIETRLPAAHTGPIAAEYEALADALDAATAEDLTTARFDSAKVARNRGRGAVGFACRAVNDCPTPRHCAELGACPIASRAGEGSPTGDADVERRVLWEGRTEPWRGDRSVCWPPPFDVPPGTGVQVVAAGEPVFAENLGSVEQTVASPVRATASDPQSGGTDA